MNYIKQLTKVIIGKEKCFSLSLLKNKFSYYFGLLLTNRFKNKEIKLNLKNKLKDENSI